MAKLTAEERKKLHLVLRKVRIAYPEVFEPKHNDLSGKDEYSVQVRLYENNPEPMKIVETIKSAKGFAAQVFWGRDAKRFLAEAEDAKNTRGLRYDADGGYYYFNAKRNASQQAPRVVGRDRTVELRPEDGKIYSGAVCNVVVDLWCYSGTAKNGAMASAIVRSVCTQAFPLIVPCSTSADMAGAASAMRSAAASAEILVFMVSLSLMNVRAHRDSGRFTRRAAGAPCQE